MRSSFLGDPMVAMVVVRSNTTLQTILFLKPDLLVLCICLNLTGFICSLVMVIMRRLGTSVKNLRLQ